VKFSGIDTALREGCRLCAFRSGGGLRVVRIEQNGKLKGYGEHPHVEDALSHANEDFLAGGRPYSKVYGNTEPHYLTGSSTSTSPLDHWLLQGHTFDAWQNGDGVVFQLKGLTEVKIPEEILDEVLRTGAPATWEHRSYVYDITRSYFPSGELCTRTRVINSPNGKEKSTGLWAYYITKTGYGKDFWTAMESAFKAEEIEVQRQ